MNKSELVSAIARKTLMSKKNSEKILQTMIDVITEQLSSGGKIQLTGFGSFDVVDRVAHEGRNPKTGEPMSFPASKFPRFKAGATLKEALK